MEIVAYNFETGIAEIDVKNKMKARGKIESIKPFGNEDIIFEDMQGNSIEEAKDGGYKIRIALDKNMAERGLITRYINYLTNE